MEHGKINKYKILNIQYTSRSMQTENIKNLALPDKEKQT
jgi:hypothetical protein